MLQPSCDALPMNSLYKSLNSDLTENNISVFIDLSRHQLNSIGGDTLNMFFLWKKMSKR